MAVRGAIYSRTEVCALDENAITPIIMPDMTAGNSLVALNLVFIPRSFQPSDLTFTQSLRSPQTPASAFTESKLWGLTA